MKLFLKFSDTFFKNRSCENETSRDKDVFNLKRKFNYASEQLITRGHFSKRNVRCSNSWKTRCAENWVMEISFPKTLKGAFVTITAKSACCFFLEIILFSTSALSLPQIASIISFAHLSRGTKYFVFLFSGILVQWVKISEIISGTHRYINSSSSDTYSIINHSFYTHRRHKTLASLDESKMTMSEQRWCCVQPITSHYGGWSEHK